MPKAGNGDPGATLVQIELWDRPNLDARDSSAAEVGGAIAESLARALAAESVPEMGALGAFGRSCAIFCT